MPDGRSSSAPTLSDSVSANKRDPPPSRPSLPPHVIPPPAAHPTAPLNTNYTVRTSYKTRTPRATPDASTGERIRARGPGGRGPTPLGATLVVSGRRASAPG